MKNPIKDEMVQRDVKVREETIKERRSWEA
jgi:hypothetical protein